VSPLEQPEFGKKFGLRFLYVPVRSLCPLFSEVIDKLICNKARCLEASGNDSRWFGRITWLAGRL